MKQISLKATSNFLKALSLAAILSITAKQNSAQMCTSPGSTIYALSNSGVSYPVTVSTDAVGLFARIYSQSGLLVNESKLISGTNAVNALSFGAYIVNVKDANGQNYNMKFVKE